MKNSWLTIPDIVTMLSLAAGVMSIFFSIKLMFGYAALFMLFSVLFDFLDGRLARMLKQESLVGAELDSLGDLVSFGAAPAAMFLAAFSSLNILEVIIAVIFVCCGAYRLARFNLQKDKKNFYGMPITMNGVFFPLLFYFDAGKYVYVTVLAVSSLLMISRFKIRKF